jgi:hypothetical protein
MEAEEKEVSEKEEEERKEEELSEREGERWRGVEGLEKGRLSHSHSASQWAVVTLPAGVLTDIRLHVVTQTPLNLCQPVLEVKHLENRLLKDTHLTPSCQLRQGWQSRRLRLQDDECK